VGHHQIRLRASARADRRGGQAMCQRQIGEHHRALRRSKQETGVGNKVGVKAQRRAPNHDAHVVGAIAGRQLIGDQRAQTTQPKERRTTAAHLAVKRVRDTDFHHVVDLLDHDETARFGVVDRCRVGDAVQRGEFEGLANRQDVHHIPRRSG